MSSIRVNKLCKQFSIAPKELVAFLQTQGIIVKSNPNAKVPDSIIPVIQKQFGTDNIPKNVEKDALPYSNIINNTQPNPEPESIITSNIEKKIALEYPSNSMCQQYGKLISLMISYIISLRGTKIASLLVERGYDKKKLDNIKNGSSQEMGHYREIAVLCIKEIVSIKKVSENFWGRPGGMSWGRFKLIIEDNKGLSASIDEYEMLWNYLKNYFGKHTEKEKMVQRKKKKKKSVHNQHHTRRLKPDEQSVRHRSYSSNSGGFDYGITDT